ncbi:MAG: tRNA lysidine(34) synthetase TilS [Cyanobacteria bacterium]|nr:tRNA lysidine(34) synthetase TilS [Cyanobacteriota bacterium]
MLSSLVLHNLQAEGFLTNARQAHFVVAFSGGLDSTVLLHVLAALRQEYPITLTAAYVDHGWRNSGPTSFPGIPEIATLVKTTQALGVPLVILPCDREQERTEHKARQARYYRLTHLTQTLKADALLTAHHADDQIETLLFRLFRGTGMEGMTGIQRKLILDDVRLGLPVAILRPCLDIFSEGIARYAEETLKPQGIEWFNDPSNNNTHYQRNHLRHEVLPLLQQRFPMLKASLLRTVELALDNTEIVQQALAPIWERVFQDNAFDVVYFNQLETAYQRSIARKLLIHWQADSDFESVERLIRFLKGGHRCNPDSALYSINASEDGHPRFLNLYQEKLTLTILTPTMQRRLSPSSDGDSVVSCPVSLKEATACEPFQVVFEALPYQPPKPAMPKVSTPKGPPVIDNPVLAEALASETSETEEEETDSVEETASEQSVQEVITDTSKETIEADVLSEIWVDLLPFDTLKLELRTRKPGDRFQPLGMAQPMRLKKYLINKKIPRFERDALLVLAHQDLVLWVVGHAMSERLRPNGRPTHRLRIHALTETFAKGES